MKRDSLLTVGPNSKIEQKSRGEGKTLKLVSESKGGLDWRFSMSSFRFKDVDLLGGASL